MVLVLVMSLSLMASCKASSPNDTAYWFSSNSYNFVKYDDAQNNLDEAGSYWNFKSATSGNITLSVRLNVDLYYSAAYLYVNGEKVPSEINTGIYTFVYKLSLNKGDSIKLHAFWVNSLTCDDEGFEIQLLTIEKDGKAYSLKEFDKTTTA
jgi:hypothetical protein